MFYTESRTLDRSSDYVIGSVRDAKLMANQIKLSMSDVGRSLVSVRLTRRDLDEIRVTLLAAQAQIDDIYSNIDCLEDTLQD